MRSGPERLQRPEGTRKMLVQGISLNGVHLQAQRSLVVKEEVATILRVCQLFFIPSKPQRFCDEDL